VLQPSLSQPLTPSLTLLTHSDRVVRSLVTAPSKRKRESQGLAVLSLTPCDALTAPRDDHPRPEVVVKGAVAGRIPAASSQG